MASFSLKRFKGLIYYAFTIWNSVISTVWKQV